MTAAELFEIVAKLSGLFFVVTSMLAMGMSLTMSQIVHAAAGHPTGGAGAPRELRARPRARLPDRGRHPHR